MVKLLLVLAAAAVLAGCGGSADLRREADFSPPPPQILYVFPFAQVMVPPTFGDAVFDRFVDLLNAEGAPSGYEFVILKQDISRIDSQWLSGRSYLTGEIFGYLEDSGCCSTALEARSRLRLHQPGSQQPTLALAYPAETFFQHDDSTLAAERSRLAEEMAAALAEGLLDVLATP